jgi:hypothetical protein
MNRLERKHAPWARLAVRLLKGPLFDDEEEQWVQLKVYQPALADYFAQIALDLIVDNRDGYAYLKQWELDEKGSTIGLIQRRPLSYEVTLLCVILRKYLDEFEWNDTSSKSCFITRKGLRTELETFFKEKANRMKLLRELNRYINEVIELGYLKQVRGADQADDEDTFEVRRILKARFDDDVLQYFLEQLKSEEDHVESI